MPEPTTIDDDLGYRPAISMNENPLMLRRYANIWGARLTLAIASKSPLVMEWIVADRYYQAKHWPARRTASWRPDPVSNMVYQIVDEHASQMSASELDATILPRKPSDADASEMFSDLWRWWYKRHKLRFILDDAFVGAVLKGTYVVKCVWDESVKGGSQDPDETEEVDEQQVYKRGRKRKGAVSPEPVKVQVPSASSGDVVAYGIDPSSFFLDPGAYELQSAAWCGTNTPMLVEEARARWPQFANLLRPEFAFNESEIYYRPSTFQSFQAAGGADGTGSYLNIFEGWEKSHRKCECGAEHKPRFLDEQNQIENPEWRLPGHEEGLVRIVMAGAFYGAPLILERQPHFYKHGKYPFGVFRDIRITKSFWGQGEFAQIKSLQDMRNRLLEQAAINAYLTGNNQRVLMTASGINPSTITSEPGKVYVSKTPNPIQPIKQENIPAYIFQLMELTKSDVQQVTGMFTAPPPGVRAGYAIIALLERLAARVKRKQMWMEDGLRDLVELVIGYYQEFGTEQRLMRVTGADGSIVFKAFRGADHATAELDVDISLGAAKPFSRAILVEMLQPVLAMKQWDGSPVLLPSEYLEAIGLPLQSIIDRNRKKEAQQAQQQQQQAGNQYPEGAQTLLGDQLNPAQVQGGQGPGGPGQGARTQNSRMIEGIGKASGNG